MFDTSQIGSGIKPDPNISKPSDPKPDEYLGTDGLLYCKKCNGAREMILQHYLGSPYPRKVRIACKCMDEQYNENIKNTRIQESIERNALKSAEIGFPAFMLKNATFENNRGGDAHAIEIAKRYCTNFKHMLETGEGIIFYGNTGTGKTYIAACIVNELQKRGYFVPITDASHLADAMSGYRVDRQSRRTQIGSASLIVIDDLGTDSKSKSTVYNLINDRYMSGKPMIITTNMNITNMKETTNVEDKRAYSRILERCYPVGVQMTDMRYEATQQQYYETRKYLVGDENDQV